MPSSRESSEFATLLRQHRLEAGLTQEALAERAGISTRSVQNLENAVTRPYRETARRLAGALALAGDRLATFEATAAPTPRARNARPFGDSARPGQAQPGAPNNLPVALPSFVGRERQIDVIERLLPTVRLLTLVGPGGCGKTRLALEIGHRMLRAYRDGVYLVPLAPVRDPELVPATIARILGVRDEGPQPVLDRLREHVRDRHLLLLLDNIEHLLPAATTVGELLAACPRLTVLATSRAALQVRGERELAVPPLALPDPRRLPPVEELSRCEAVALFAERAATIRPDFAVTTTNAAIVAEICRRLDGLPLAIELAAARIRLLSPDAMLARLERRLPLLTGGARDLPDRQRTLTATITWSYDLLTSTEQALLRRLAVFVGGAGLEAIEAVCVLDGEFGIDVSAGPGQAVLDGVTALAAQSMVLLSEGPDAEPRVGMLETIREYAEERLEESGEAATIRHRHLGWFAELAEHGQAEVHGPDGVTWIARLTAELGNFRAALAWSLTDPHPVSVQAGLRTAGALFQFWWFYGHLAEGRRWLAQVLAADRESSEVTGPAADRSGSSGCPEPRLPTARTGAFGTHPRVVALNSFCMLNVHLGDLEQARQATGEALVLARDVRDRLGHAHALTSLGLVARTAGDYERAAALLEEGLSAFRYLGDRFGTWRAVHALAMVATELGDGERARALAEESLALARSMGHLWGMAQGLQRLGVIAHREGDFDCATALLEESLARWRQARSNQGGHGALSDLGHVVLARGDPRWAADCFAEGLSLGREAGDRPGVARCLEGLAMAAIAAVGESSARLGHAARLLAAAAALREAVGSPIAPPDRPIVERGVLAARESLGDSMFAAAWAEGRAMSLEQAVAYALDLDG